MNSVQTLEDIPRIKRDVILAPYTTWRIGGPARYFWEPDAERVPAVLRYCYQEGILVYYLGRGSNVLIDDAGLPGLVICTKKSLQNMTHRDGLIIAEAGVPLPALSKYAADLGYGGYEFLIGIPGTVGAGVAINAGLSARVQREIKDVLHSVDVVTLDGNLLTLSANELNLRYRGSDILEQGLYVLRGYFNLSQPAAQSEIRQHMATHLADRRRKQPLSKATAGSTFKQPEGGRPAGWYIDRAGLKGHRIGGAVVSQKHANWIENKDGATARDVKQLINNIQQIVNEKFGVFLEQEIRYLS